MTTPYCDKDGFANREKGLTWNNYVKGGFTYPNPEELETSLEMGARIINRTIGNITSNITDSAYTSDLEDINYKLATRIMAVKRNRSFMGGNFMFSPQDYLFSMERGYLQDIGRLKLKRKVGKWVF